MHVSTTYLKPGRSGKSAFGLVAAVAGSLGVLLLILLMLPARPPATQSIPAVPTVRNPPARAATTPQTAVTIPAAAAGPTARVARASVKVAPSTGTGDTRWTPIIARMKDAMDNGDSEGALIFARQLMTAADVGARREALDMFRWLGAEALPELTRMLTDPDGELAQLALDGWKDSLGEVTDHAGNVRPVVEAVTALQDPAARHTLMIQISLLPDVVAAEYYSGMLNAGDKVVVELAREYLTFIAQTPIETKADAAHLLANLQREAAANK
jgi:hypothetical protein